MALYIISGGPGSGKTTLLTALHRAGFAVAEEVSRQLIQEQVALGSNQVPWLDLAGFADLALTRMVAQHQLATRRGGVTFFDRGLPDLLAYLVVAGQPVPPTYYAAVATHRYQPQVFMAPPWPEIYVNDTERWQTFDESVTLYHALRLAYQQVGYTVVELPKTTVAARVDFVRAVAGL